VRVVLLFYLMPVWTVLLARLLLGERFTARTGLRIALGLAGAITVLWPADTVGLAAGPVPRTLADGLGLLGGFSFALDNLMLRREAVRPEEGRALAMFVGGALVAGAVATALALLFLVGNLSLQYGAARLPANRTAVVMLTEVLFASVSALILGGEVLTMPLLIGGGLIALAAALSAVTPSVRPSAPAPLQEPVR